LSKRAPRAKFWQHWQHSKPTRILSEWLAAGSCKAQAVAQGEAATAENFAKGTATSVYRVFNVAGVTCPGAGECLDFAIHSVHGATLLHFFRQCQNAYLMRFNREAITQALAAIPGNF
jgi:hypothetical protein